MTRVEILFRALTEREQANRERRPAFDPDQSLGPDQLASRTEQRMPVRHGPHRDTIHLLDRPHQQLTLDAVDAIAVRAESVVADDQGKRNRINSEDQRPFLSNDVKQIVDAVRLECGNHGLMDGGDSSGVTARKGDEVLIGLFNRAETLAQARKCLVLELDHSSHRGDSTLATVNFLQRARRTDQRAAIFTASRASLISARVPSLASVMSASSA